MYKRDGLIKRFEKEIFLALEERGLIEHSKHPLFYLPSSPDETYVKTAYNQGRRWLANHGKITGAAALGGALCLHFLNPDFAPKLVKWFGVIGAGVIGARTLDEYLSQDQSNIAKRYFQHKPKNWMDPYVQLDICDKKILDEYVLIAQIPSAIYDGKSDTQDEASLGAGIAKIADILSQVRVDSKQIKGLTLEHLVAMLPKQKSRSDQDQAMIQYLTTAYPTKRLVEELRKQNSTLTGIEVIQRYVQSYEFVLRTTNVERLQSVGAMLSKGYIVIEKNAGTNTATHIGSHSIGKDCPRVLVKGDAAHSFMNRAKRGVGVVDGTTSHDLMKQSEGGICLVKGRANGLIGQNMTDSNWPAIIISVGGLEFELRDAKKQTEGVKDGLILSLNESRTLNQPHSEIMFFENGQMTKQIVEKEHSIDAALAMIRQYILSWEPKK